MFKIIRSLRYSKCPKTTAELTFTTEKANACSPWTAGSVFDWKYLFWLNLVQKLKMISLSWNSIPGRIQYAEFHGDVHFFCFRLEITFSANLIQKSNCQFELKVRTRLIWICRIMYTICGVHVFCFRPEKHC